MMESLMTFGVDLVSLIDSIFSILFGLCFAGMITPFVFFYAPAPLDAKILYALLLLTSLVLVFMGWRKRKKWTGKLLIFTGITLWILFSFLAMLMISGA